MTTNKTRQTDIATIHINKQHDRSHNNTINERSAAAARWTNGWWLKPAASLSSSPPCLKTLTAVPNYETHLFFSLVGFPGQTSCHDTGDPTRGSNPTSVQCVRRSLPAVTTCQNTSKSTVFHEAAGRFVQRTEGLPDQWVNFHTETCLGGVSAGTVMLR